MTNFSIDEQIFFKNDKTNKVYTLTLNQNDKPKTYDVTREWTVPNQAHLASKTDKFPIFRQAAELMDHLYNERIKKGYIEVMRRQGIKKQSGKIEKHLGTETRNDYAPTPDQPVTSIAPGKQVENAIQSRHVTTIQDRLQFLKNRS